MFLNKYNNLTLHLKVLHVWIINTLTINVASDIIDK